MKYCNLIINGEKYGFDTEAEAERVARMERTINPNAKIEMTDFVESDLYELDLPISIHNRLIRAGVYSVEDVRKHEHELEKVRNLGTKAIRTIREALAAYQA